MIRESLRDLAPTSGRSCPIRSLESYVALPCKKPSEAVICSSIWSWGRGILAVASLIYREIPSTDDPFTWCCHEFLREMSFLLAKPWWLAMSHVSTWLFVPSTMQKSISAASRLGLHCVGTTWHKHFLLFLSEFWEWIHVWVCRRMPSHSLVSMCEPMGSLIEDHFCVRAAVVMARTS